MEDYVNFEQAKKLKKLGFDWECDYLYDDKDLTKYDYYQEFYNEQLYYNCISAPTLAQAQKWLREVKDVIVYNVACYNPSVEIFEWDCFIHYTTKDDEIDESTINHPTYEQALSVGIDKALELLKHYTYEG